MGLPPQAGPSSPRARLILAGGLALVLVAVVMVVVVSGGGEDKGPPPEPPDPECISAWNDDTRVVIQGQHQYTGHQYRSVQVLRIAPDGGPLPEKSEKGSAGERGGEVLGPGKGQCTVAFAAGALDSEAAAAALTYTGNGWMPVSGLPAVDSGRLVDLQAEAQDGANADLQVTGELEPK